MIARRTELHLGTLPQEVREATDGLHRVAAQRDALAAGHDGSDGAALAGGLRGPSDRPGGSGSGALVRDLRHFRAGGRPLALAGRGPSVAGRS